MASIMIKQVLTWWFFEGLDLGRIGYWLGNWAILRVKGAFVGGFFGHSWVVQLLVVIFSPFTPRIDWQYGW